MNVNAMLSNGCGPWRCYPSGGVIAKTRPVNLPMVLLKAVGLLDDFLVRISPNVFALGCFVVLKKELSASRS
ncbi:hypothetical protein [Oceanidesulfovibrio marinus]|uniref:Uncharacterized protein n=1 Tax=Oceanidesulfovibrio marinus TaxID=370038 RepID=A0ABX6NJ82_9BACT|nr:hypothetical protein [Oceanidesulfovibrio marinus]QJT10281.1 hypothetical protein E8L03_15690 [Oceanidesulfovibrio marinus]